MRNNSGGDVCVELAIHVSGIISNMYVDIEIYGNFLTCAQ